MSITMLSFKLTNSNRAPLTKHSLKRTYMQSFIFCLGVCICMCHCTHVEERTQFESQFSTSARWGLGQNSGLQTWQQVLSLAESSHQPRTEDIAQLVSACLTCMNLISLHCTNQVYRHICGSSTLEIEARGSEFRVILGYIESWRPAWITGD